MTKAIALITMCFLVTYSGCGMVSVMSRETRHEKNVPAEYDIITQKDKIALVVESAAWSSVPASVTQELIDVVRLQLTETIELKPKYLIEQSKIAQALSEKKSTFTEPVEIGKAVDADIVLYVQLEDYKIVPVPETDYLKGNLSGRAAIYRCSSGKMVWPGSTSGKIVSVGFDVEKGSFSIAQKRLIRAFSHCTTRYLYECPLPKFKIHDDLSGEGWNQWQD